MFTVALCSLLLLSFHPQATATNSKISWQELMPGLSLFTTSNPDLKHLLITKINPKFFSFKLLMASEQNIPPMPLTNWSKQFNLLLAINASMYLKDNKTSTGYMKNGESFNNPRIVRNMGAIFVCNPKQPDLPEAQILDIRKDDIATLLPLYNTAFQNFRLIDDAGNSLWPQETTVSHAIAAIAEDTQNNIFFIYSDASLSPHLFSQLILDVIPDIKRSMYVEGGNHAGLYINTDLPHLQVDLNNVPFIPLALPNVLGITPKNQ